MTGDSLSLLLIQADHVAAQKLQLGLERYHRQAPNLLQVASLVAASRALGQRRVDAILFDSRVNETATARHELRRLKELAAAPVILLAADETEPAARGLVESGIADDLVPCDIAPHELARALRHNLERDRLRRELQAARRGVAASERRFLGLIENDPDGVVVLADDGSVLHGNRAAAQMLGRKAGGLLGQKLDDLQTEGEVTLLRPDGTALSVEVRLLEIEWEGRRARVASLHDLGPGRQREKALRLAHQEAERANAMKTRFLANMSHELRTPLNSILGFSEMIGSGVFGPVGHPKYGEYAANIHESATHLLGLISDLLDVSRAEAGRFALSEQSFPIVGTIQAAVEYVAPKARDCGLSLEVEASSVEGLMLRGDKQRIHQVLVNLLSNAVKFTSEGGHVRLAARLQPGGDLLLVVSDDGIGMAENQIEDAFQAYIQLSDIDIRKAQQGSGLGLALSRLLVEMHDGWIDLQSRPGHGTRVTVRLPAERVSQPYKAPVIDLASRGSVA